MINVKWLKQIWFAPSHKEKNLLNMDKKEIILVTGSNGWLSQNFLRILNNKNTVNRKIIKISKHNDWKK